MQLSVGVYNKASYENIVIMWVFANHFENHEVTCNAETLAAIPFGFSFWPRDHETTRLGVGLGIFDKIIYLGYVGEWVGGLSWG